MPAEVARRRSIGCLIVANHKIPAERPRVSKRFLTAREVEDMAAANVTEIVFGPDLVITDAARELAADLGITIISEEEKRRRSGAAKPGTPSPGGLVGQAPPVGAPVTYTGADSGVRPGTESRHQPDPQGEARTAAEDPLVRAIVDAIQARWRPAQRYARQLLGPESG